MSGGYRHAQLFLRFSIYLEDHTPLHKSEHMFDSVRDEYLKENEGKIVIKSKRLRLYPKKDIKWMEKIEWKRILTFTFIPKKAKKFSHD